MRLNDRERDAIIRNGSCIATFLHPKPRKGIDPIIAHIRDIIEGQREENRRLAIDDLDLYRLARSGARTTYLGIAEHVSISVDHIIEAKEYALLASYRDHLLINVEQRHTIRVMSIDLPHRASIGRDVALFA